MNEIIDFIHQQFTFNRNKNLYYSEINSSMKFIEETQFTVEKIKNLKPEEEKYIVEYTTNTALEEFCQVNQYYSFSENDKKQLKKIYLNLLSAFKKIESGNKQQIKSFAENHFSGLKDWLQQTNTFSQKIYKTEDEFAKIVTCSEYTPELQLNLLGINLSECMHPVLDIGCGKQANLVQYLRKKEIETFGIDRFEPANAFCSKADWLEYDYEKNKWGTIISHLGFSNHFNHHHLRIDGNFKEYAKKYMEILHSLKSGGTFIYTPDLPFIEKYLDSSIYNVSRFEIGKEAFKTTKITLI